MKITGPNCHQTFNRNFFSFDIRGWSVPITHILITMIQGYGPVTQALLGTLLTWGLTALGSSMVIFLRGNQVRKKHRFVLKKNRCILNKQLARCLFLNRFQCHLNTYSLFIEKIIGYCIRLCRLAKNRRKKNIQLENVFTWVNNFQLVLW